MGKDQTDERNAETIDMSPAEPSTLSYKDRLSAVLNEYGPLALAVYFAIFLIVLVTFAWAIGRGFGHVIDGWMKRLADWLPGMSGASASTGTAVGTWGAAYVATKLTQPLRIAATLAITPLVGALRRRRERRG